MRVRRGVAAEAVNQSAQHVLFVEGTEDGVDVAWLRKLFVAPLEVKPLGASFHVKSVAQALHAHHPNYYFLTDRDHASDQEVESAWQGFPDPAKHNLLIWPRKEIESYFVDPTVFSRSEYLKPDATVEKIRAHLLQRAQEMLFLAAANASIVEIRESMKQKWLQLFANPFATRDDAEVALSSAIQNSPLPERVKQNCDSQALKLLYAGHLEALSGGGETVEWGKGRWLELLPAKSLLNEMVSKFTTVKGDDGRLIQGPARLKRVVSRLLEDELVLPEDFRRLRELINGRVLAG